MADFVKLIIIFVAIVIGIRKKVFVGLILLGAGILTAALFQVNFGASIDAFLNLLISKNFLYLYGIIILITFLGRILREIGYLDRLVNATDNLRGGARTASAVLPALIGLMPMPGGALLSAPLVGRVLSKPKYSPEFKTAVNYWSRHVLEFFWPVYPGLVLSATLTGVTIGKISLLQLPMTLIMIPIGIIFMIRKIDKKEEGGGQLANPILKILGLMWPILLAISISIVFHIPLIWAVAAALGLLMLKERPKWQSVRPVLKEALAPRLLVLVIGVLYFQEILELSGAVESIPKLSTELGLPAELVIISVSFISGLLTGILFALIGLSYPLLAGYLYQPDINMANIFLAFVSGYIGMIFSPTHFCLILTNEYFKSNLGLVYKLLTIPLLVLFAAGLALYLAGWPWGLFAVN